VESESKGVIAKARNGRKSKEREGKEGKERGLSIGYL